MIVIGENALISSSPPRRFPMCSAERNHLPLCGTDQLSGITGRIIRCCYFSNFVPSSRHVPSSYLLPYREEGPPSVIAHLMAWSGSPLPLRQPPKINAGRIPVRSPDVDTVLSRWGLVLEKVGVHHGCFITNGGWLFHVRQCTNSAVEAVKMRQVTMVAAAYTTHHITAAPVELNGASLANNN